MQPCNVQVVASRDQVITFYHADLGGGGLAHEMYLRGSCNGVPRKRLVYYEKSLGPMETGHFFLFLHHTFNQRHGEP